MDLASHESANFINIYNKVGETRVKLGSDIDIPGYIAIFDGADGIKWSAP